jgi:hypothetical protein
MLNELANITECLENVWNGIVLFSLAERVAHLPGPHSDYVFRPFHERL